MSLIQASAAPARSAPLIASLDPRTRLLAAVGLAVVVVSLSSMSAKLLAVVFASGLVAMARIEARAVLHRLAHIEGFMAVLLILLPLTVDGRALLAWGPFSVSDRGLQRALHIVLTVNAAALTALALLGALEPIRLGRAMAALGINDRFVRLFLFVVSYHGVFGAEIRRQADAMRARAFRAGLSRRAFRAYGNLAGMILVRSIERAERVDEAMRCRGFTGRFPLRRVRPMTGADARFALLAVAACAVLIAVDRLA